MKAVIKKKQKIEEEAPENRDSRFVSNGEGVLFFRNTEEFLAYKKKLKELEAKKE